jgi:hypothetical protein
VAPRALSVGAQCPLLALRTRRSAALVSAFGGKADTHRPSGLRKCCYPHEHFLTVFTFVASAVCGNFRHHCIRDDGTSSYHATLASQWNRLSRIQYRRRSFEGLIGLFYRSKQV